MKQKIYNALVFGFLLVSIVCGVASLSCAFLSLKGCAENQEQYVCENPDHLERGIDDYVDDCWRVSEKGLGIVADYGSRMGTFFGIGLLSFFLAGIFARLTEEKKSLG